uniref:Uncharacterized protein n=1 Tax=viral metagenome TaxID=1070528 RepID=A0A6C0CCS6_9ZZZZ
MRIRVFTFLMKKILMHMVNKRFNYQCLNTLQYANILRNVMSLWIIKSIWTRIRFGVLIGKGQMRQWGF